MSRKNGVTFVKPHMHPNAVFIEGSLEVKLPTYGQMQQQLSEQSGERKSQKRKSQKRKSQYRKKSKVL